MQGDLPSDAKESRRQMRVSVAEEQQQLEEEHTDGPDGRTSPVPRQYVLADQRLYLKQQKRAGEDRHCVRDVQGSRPRFGAR